MECHPVSLPVKFVRPSVRQLHQKGELPNPGSTAGWLSCNHQEMSHCLSVRLSVTEKIAWVAIGLLVG